MVKKIIFGVLAVLVSGVVWLACDMFFRGPTGISAEQRAAILKEPRLHVENYDFDPASSLESRIKSPPPFILKYLKEYDRVENYTPYELTPDQRKLVSGYLERFPSVIKKLLKARLLGIYFIENFTGNGLTTPVLGAKGEIYVWLVVNPAGLKKTLSEILTERDNSAFRTGGVVKVDCGADTPGVLYPLAHETGHAVDYLLKMTPYVTPEWDDLVKGGPPPVLQRWDVWIAYDAPDPGSDFDLRDKLRFYGLNGGAALDASDAAELYSGLGRSPFVSLYGSQNWAEDYAERLFYVCLKGTLNRVCAVQYPGGKGTEVFVPNREADGRALKLYKTRS